MVAIRRFVCIKKIRPLIFIKLLLSIFVTTQILLFFQIILKICVFRETVSKLIFNSISLTYFIIMSLFTFNSMKSFRKTIERFDNELVINLPLSIDCSMYNIFLCFEYSVANFSLQM